MFLKIHNVCSVSPFFTVVFFISLHTINMIFKIKLESEWICRYVLGCSCKLRNLQVRVANTVFACSSRVFTQKIFKPNRVRPHANGITTLEYSILPNPRNRLCDLAAENKFVPLSFQFDSVICLIPRWKDSNSNIRPSDPFAAALFRVLRAEEHKNPSASRAPLAWGVEPSISGVASRYRRRKSSRRADVRSSVVAMMEQRSRKSNGRRGAKGELGRGESISPGIGVYIVRFYALIGTF